jgi:carbon-monoxide dehydrogenase medium subunit
VTPAAFDYHRPTTLDEALQLLTSLGENARPLAGGHSLLPAMKLRLAQPSALVDLGGVAELQRIDERGGRVSIGAMATHGQILASTVLASKCPLFTKAAYHIGDLQVRNLGTIGGSLAHADPAADWPAVVLALDAEIEIASQAGRRTIPAAEFFVDVLQTSLQPGEIVCAVHAATTASAVAYVKTEQKASGFALCGVAAVIDKAGKGVRIGITGVGPKAYRATHVERALEGRALDQAAIDQAARAAAEGVDAMGDIHASSEFRSHLARVNTARALKQAAGV